MTVRPCNPVVRRSALVAALVLAATAARAQDDDVGFGGPGPSTTSFAARLTGLEETPSIVTTGNGTLKLTIAQDGTIAYTLTFAKLEGAPTVAHVHVGQRGVAGGVAAFLCGGGGKPDCPAGGGTVSGTIVAADVLGPAAQGIQPGQLDRLLVAMRAGVTYANVHSALHAEGEIRGQIRRDHW